MDPKQPATPIKDANGKLSLLSRPTFRVPLAPHDQSFFYKQPWTRQKIIMKDNDLVVFMKIYEEWVKAANLKFVDKIASIKYIVPVLKRQFELDKNFRPNQLLQFNKLTLPNDLAYLICGRKTHTQVTKSNALGFAVALRTLLSLVRAKLHHVKKIGEVEGPFFEDFDSRILLKEGQLKKDMEKLQQLFEKQESERKKKTTKEV